jgi:hypothetical protein
LTAGAGAAAMSSVSPSMDCGKPAKVVVTPSFRRVRCSCAVVAKVVVATVSAGVGDVHVQHRAAVVSTWASRARTFPRDAAQVQAQRLLLPGRKGEICE